MRVIQGEADRGPIISISITLGALAVLTLTTLMGLPSTEVAALVTVTIVGALGYRTLLQWHALIALMLLVILFVPIKRYRMPVELPFELEPYRVVVALVAAAWLTSLLIDPRVRLRLSGFEGPLFLFAASAVGSVLVNDARIKALDVEAKVVKELTFLLSFFLVVYLIVSVTRSPRALRFLIELMVISAAVISVLAVIEARTGFNLFAHLSVLPFLEPDQQLAIDPRGGRFRAIGPAQHPIALGAALVLFLPLAIYLARVRGQRRWWLAVVLLALGILAPFSRTSVVMLFVVGLVFLWLRPRETRRLWPALLPALIVVHFALPATIGGLKASFFPKGGLIADQSQSVGSRGQGRIADLSPGIDEFLQRPVLGQGFGTRVVDGENPNAQILDNQWLKSLLETGAVGAFALLWLFWRAIRRLAAVAKSDSSDRGWLAVALAASIAAFAFGMFTYDAFAFIQATFLMFILLAFAALELGPSRVPARSPDEGMTPRLGARALRAPGA